MNTERKGFRPLVARRWMVLALAFVGCASGPHFVARPDYGAVAQSSRVLLIYVPQVKVYEIGANNKLMLDEKWSEQGLANVTSAVMQAMIGRGYVVKPVTAEMASIPEFAALTAEYESVTPALLEKLNSRGGTFDISLMTAPECIALAGASAMVVAVGGDQISSGGRTAAIIGKSLLAGLAGYSYSEPSGATWMQLAFVDGGGRVMYYDFHRSVGSHDLRNPKSAQDFVSSFVEHMQEALEAK